MKIISYDIDKFNNYQSDKELLEFELKEMLQHKNDYYSFSNFELALAFFNYIELKYPKATFHVCYGLGQCICLNDLSRRKLRCAMMSVRDKLLKQLADVNSAMDEIW